MLGGVAQEPRVGQVAHEGRIDAGRVEELVVVVGGLLGPGEQAGEGTGVVALEDGADRRQRESAGLEGADALEALEVLGAEAAGAPAALAARQQALALVVADRVDRDPGPLRQLVDAPVAHGSDLKAGGTDVET